MGRARVATAAGSAWAEWKAHWRLVLSAAIGFSLFSVMLGAVGVFMAPLGKEFGWDRTFLSWGSLIMTVMTAVLAPAAGALIDRYGSRRVVLPGLVLTVLMMSAFSLLNGSHFQWLAFWFVLGTVTVLIKSTAWTAAVLGSFSQSRGLALGLTLSGTALTQIVVSPLANWLITDFGWRAAFVWIAVGWGGLTFLLCFFFFFENRDRERLKPSAVAAPPVELQGLSSSEALRNSALWRLGISNFVVMLFTQGMTFHQVPILEDTGVPRGEAVWLVSLSGVAAIVGKLLTGVLLDRYRPNWVGGITLGASALAFLLLVGGISSPVVVVIAMLVNGYTFGTKTQITGNLTASYGGMKNFGKIYGTMAALMALAAGVGAPIAGRVFDTTGSYAMFLWAGGIGCALSGLLMITLPAYPKWDRPTPA